jgi:uncharacterized membrane protein YdjX (TVP38/TMEM64 family)
MEPPLHPSGRRLEKRQLVLAVVGVLLITAAVLVVWRTGLMATLQAIVLTLREAGPGVFFVAMAFLPAVGFPLMAFTLAAGPVFGPTMGTGWVIGWSLTAVMVNLLLTYWLANRAFRPLATRLFAWFGFKLPDSTSGGAWQLALIVRLTPGPPFWVQSYVLGLIRVPLVPYLVVSMLVMAGFIVALVAGGEAAVQGNGRLAIVAISVLLISVAVLQLLRKRTARRLTAAGARD